MKKSPIYAKVTYFLILLSLVPGPLTMPALAAERFLFDKSRTMISFSASYLGFTDITGNFSDYDGSFLVNDSHPEESRVNILLRSSGIRTSNRVLDKLLQGRNWFNSGQFPEIRFVSTAIQVTGRRTARLTGNLTLLGRSRPIILTIRFEPPARSRKICFDAEGLINRPDFGMDYLTPLVADKVQVFIHAVGIEQNNNRLAPISTRMHSAASGKRMPK